MKEILPEAWMWRHLWLHGITLAAAVFSLWWMVAVWLFILCLVLQSLLLGYMLLTAITIYRRTLKLIELEKSCSA